MIISLDHNNPNKSVPTLRDLYEFYQVTLYFLFSFKISFDSRVIAFKISWYWTHPGFFCNSFIYPGLQPRVIQIKSFQDFNTCKV